MELAKDWRTDRVLRRLEAMLLTANLTHLLLISGTGDVVEPEEDVIAIGSGGNFAYAEAKAYLDSTEFSAREIVEKSLRIAAGICIFTNDSLIIEELV
ncbi:ATP-dependent protease subunit HslV [subsurface metagenome]